MADEIRERARRAADKMMAKLDCSWEQREIAEIIAAEFTEPWSDEPPTNILRRGDGIWLKRFPSSVPELKIVEQWIGVNGLDVFGVDGWGFSTWKVEYPKIQWQRVLRPAS